MEQIILERLNETVRPLPFSFKKESFTLNEAFDLMRTSKNMSPAGGRPAALKLLERMEKKNIVALNNDRKTWRFNAGE